MTNEEVCAFQAEYKRFTRTVAGKALHGFKNCLISEVMDGENESTSTRTNINNEAATKVHYDALVAEIKRLQALEPPT